MSEKLVCLECGKELPEVGAISGYCSKSCYQKAYRNKKKSNSDKAKELVEELPSIVESIKEGLGQAIEMEELDRLRKENGELKKKLEENEKLSPTLEEIKSEFCTQITINDEIKNALNVINKHFGKCNDVQPFHNRQSELDQQRNDVLHAVENIELKSPDDVIMLTNKLRKIMVERRVVKESINCYKSLSRIEGLSKIDWSDLNSKNYNPKALDLGKFKSGDEIDLSKLDNTLASEEYKAIIEELHSVPVTSKYSSKQIGFVKNNVKDLEQKLFQMRNCNAKYTKFRVIGNVLHCYN